jgi:hypothetical protein
MNRRISGGFCLLGIQTPTAYPGGGRFLLEREMTDGEILTLVDRLERCLLSPSEFHHHQHLAVATAYLYTSDFESALDLMRASLCRFVAHHGGNRYHETATRFWMIQVETHLDRSLCLGNAVERITVALGNKDLIHAYYSRERLDSAEARQSWIPPDLQAMSLLL